MEAEIRFCRLCLTTSVVYYSLLKNNGKEMVLSLTGLEIKENDPCTESCAKCWLDLKLAYFIQYCFLEADKRLKSTDPNPFSEIKIEETIVDTKTEYIEEIENSPDGDFATIPKCNEVGDDSNVSEDDDDEYQELIYIQTEENDIEEKQLCICAICGMGYKDETLLYCHISTHYNGPQQCDECPENVPSIHAYQDHIQTKHPQLYGATHICGICSLSFKYKSLYNLHLAGLHPQTAKTGKIKHVVTLTTLEDNDSPYQCGPCKKVFTNKKSHAAHMNNHIKKICPVCGATITRFSSHILTHTIKPVKCDICGKVCKHIESLKWHKYNTHKNLKIRTCEKCGKQFKKLYPFKLHMRTHSAKTSICDICGKRFTTIMSLNKHIKIVHLKEFPHTCEYCNEAFAKKDSLQAHERKHTNELPYVCKVCFKGFRHNNSLQAHRKIHMPNLEK